MITVRPLQDRDIPQIVRYWTHSGDAHLQAMGVDLSKVPAPEQLAAGLERQLSLPVEERMAYCLIWEIDGVPSGHCNTNPTHFGEEAFMHLHLWEHAQRRSGLGLRLVKASLPHFFSTLQLQRLYSEPYALNPAPNRTLGKAGFVLEKEYVTTPGSINFEQPVKRWVLTRETYEQLYRH
ncbi:GNAT family N-acetyltransferase [Flaviaesturariibacter flavus]|nr:GNAT family protein [Flaviaesturariibacter flavus]